MNFEEALNVARAAGWSIGEEPQTLPAKIAADRVARMIQERGQAIKAPAYGSAEYELLVKRGQLLTLKSDSHRRSDRFWQLLPGYLRIVEACEAKFGAVRPDAETPAYSHPLKASDIHCKRCGEPANTVPYSMAGQHHVYGPRGHRFAPVA